MQCKHKINRLFNLGHLFLKKEYTLILPYPSVASAEGQSVCYLCIRVLKDN